MATTMVHIRVDEKIKRQAAKTLAAMGISVSDAVRMLLIRVAAEKALPFEVKVPNATTVTAMKAAERGGKALQVRRFANQRPGHLTLCETSSAARSFDAM
jgi:DNA-damage-inducible protein J